MPIKSFKDLLVWQKSFELTEVIYNLSTKLPASEKFGLASQMQRSAASIPSNIAEGCSRNNRGEYLQFIGIARGSAAELETQLLLAEKIYSIDVKNASDKLTEVRKMLTSLNQSLRKLPTTH